MLLKDARLLLARRADRGTSRLATLRQGISGRCAWVIRAGAENANGP